MYILFGILLILCIFFLFINDYRKKKIIRRLRSMGCCTKVCLLNELIEPFGFSYLPAQDIITSTQNAWQREFGYRALYDKTAPHFNMIFDCEPVYFNYEGRTWLIEFWKGQYGINTGGEIGIYYADSIVTPDKLPYTQFHSVPDELMFPVSMDLFHGEERIFTVRQKHWWLTGFRMGTWSEPEALTMNASITFPNDSMLQSFADALSQMGYPPCDMKFCNLTVSFTFSVPHTRQPHNTRHFRAKISQWKNRLFCRLYLRITRPFVCTSDRLLYLYYFLPFCFRHTLRFRKCRKQKCRRYGRRRKCRI